MRLVALVAVGLAAMWFGLVENDWMDRRPVQRMLWLGDSYTYYNDMPAMVAEMADSAGSPVRYDIVMRAFPNATLSDHWKSRPTRALLAQGGWDRVILQPETQGRVLEAGDPHFESAGRLVATAGKARPAIVVSWAPDVAHYPEGASARAEHLQTIARNHDGLAVRTGGELIDLARIWEDVGAEPLPFSLYKDGNHPSLEGSYLAALVAYACLARAPTAEVRYVPGRMREEDAALLRARVDSALRVRSMGPFSAG